MSQLLGQRDPRWRVRYPDGRVSTKMDRSTAYNYAEMFGGEVECIDPRWHDEIPAGFEPIAGLIIGATICTLLYIFVVLWIGG